jgi:dihydroorotate dehydrogenase
MYQLIKKILFTLDPERAHHLALTGLQLAYQFKLTRFLGKTASTPCSLMGLHFPNPIGLAAGYDKNADYIDALATLGFGFIEIGTVTPKPQNGNLKPRLFRLPEHNALINRMGFNNKGVAHVKRQLQNTCYRGILGVNIGKNKDTPNEKAVDDYLIGFRELAPFASYVTINISSPNTEGLRHLQQRNMLDPLLSLLKKEQKQLAVTQKKVVPLVVKVSPDMNEQEVHDIASTLLQHEIDGVIATNTTVTREGVEHSVYAKEQGGLSGSPLRTRSTEMIKQLKNKLQDDIPIIACGGIMNEETAREKMLAGAKLIQLYTGLIYEGPALIKKLSNIPEVSS